MLFFDLLFSSAQFILETTFKASILEENMARTTGAVGEALAAGADHLLLDNFTPDQVREALAKIAGRAKVEVSGGITLENIRAYAEPGADFISAGALTDSARAVDSSVRLE